MPTMKIQVVRRAYLTADSVAYAQRKIAGLTRYSREPIGLARLTFTVSGSPAVHQHLRIRAQLDLDGRMLVAQAEAPTAREAVDALDTRLKRRLQRMNPHWEARRSRTVRPDRRGTARPADTAEDEGPGIAGP